MWKEGVGTVFSQNKAREEVLPFTQLSRQPGSWNKLCVLDSQCLVFGFLPWSSILFLERCGKKPYSQLQVLISMLGPSWTQSFFFRIGELTVVSQVMFGVPLLNLGQLSHWFSERSEAVVGMMACGAGDPSGHPNDNQVCTLTAEFFFSKNSCSMG